MSFQRTKIHETTLAQSSPTISSLIDKGKYENLVKKSRFFDKSVSEKHFDILPLQSLKRSATNPETTAQKLALGRAHSVPGDTASTPIGEVKN